MAKKLLFDLNVDASASFETNAREFYSKALLGDDSAKRSSRLFRELLVLGESTKLGNLVVDDVIQEHGCDFESTDASLYQKTITPEILSIGVEVCQWDIEQSFLSEYTSNVGAIDFSNTSGLTPEFRTYLLEEIGRKLSNNIEQLTWKGSKNGTTGTYLDLADGLSKKLKAASTVVKVQNTILTINNIVDEIAKVYDAIPDALDYDVKIGLSVKAMRLYKMAVAKQNNINFITAALADKMIDYEIVVLPGIDRNDIVATVFEKNMVYGTDITRDAELSIINMKQTTGDRKLRIIGDFKFAVDFLNPEEIVYYTDLNS